MKKYFLIIFTTILLASCGPSAVVQEARRTMNGDWTLTEISYPGSSQTLNVRLFEDTTPACLENSEWTFVSNNNTGSYRVTSPQCNPGPRFFIWSIDEGEAAAGGYDFMLKPTDAEYRSTTGDRGFRINIVRLSGTEMVWEQTVNFEGSPFTIRMNFTKN